jgi:hypothetical protein
VECMSDKERGVQSIKIPIEQYTKLKQVADKEDRRLSRVIARAVDFWFLHRHDVTARRS